MRSFGGRAAGFVALLSSFSSTIIVDAGPVYGRQASSTGSSVASVTTTGSSVSAASSASATSSSSATSSTTKSDSKSSSASVANAPSPWISVQPDGPPITITPVVTTIDGVATTVDAPPAAFASTAPGEAIPSPSSGSFPVCHDSSGSFKPFCQPTNGSDAWVGETYFELFIQSLVTWDANYFSSNSTVSIWLNYADPKGGGREAWHSEPRPNSYGFVSVKMDNSWRKDQPRNNLTFYLVELGSNAGHTTYFTGPTVSLVNKPAQHYPPPPRIKPNKLGITVGLPIGLGFVLLVVCGLWAGMRKHRRIGLGNINIGRNKGYGIGKSKRQRMKRSKKAGPIQLDDDITIPPRNGGFRDNPNDGVELEERTSRPRGHARDDSLGSLAGSPTEGAFRRDQRQGGNVFRDEVTRQQTGSRP
ncbi:MAG: hypothetical protein M1813_006927 [Trichoglossum hirsutum]|nr:MAG: hypothetical protein M1813_006927 [Trichoglossum hirsutum]